MATVSESTSNFIQGLSDLWLRFFKDKPTLEALYSGMQIPIGQAYLDLLGNVLNISVRETPIFRKEFFKLLTIREDLAVYDAGTDTYSFELTSYSIRDFRFLFNKIFSPSVILEKDVDFVIETRDAIGIQGTADFVVFNKDLFNWEGGTTPIPGVAYRTVDVLQDDGTSKKERELAFWIPDVLIDRYDLYLNYGYLINCFAPSSESYRAFLQGIIQYFVLGPTVKYMTSALNVIMGLPVIRNEGEILQSVDSTDPLYTFVSTDKATYQFSSSVPIRDDILDESNWGTLTFTAFEYLSNVASVHDVINDPTWYYGIEIPLLIMPDEPQGRRVVDPEPNENCINIPDGLIKVGDPGFIIGRDDDGGVPTGGRNPLRHNFAYIVFERFLKQNIFFIEFVPNVEQIVPYPRVIADLKSIIMPGKSAYTYLFLAP